MPGLRQGREPGTRALYQYHYHRHFLVDYYGGLAGLLKCGARDRQGVGHLSAGAHGKSHAPSYIASKFAVLGGIA
jgi:hypothetical protein